MIRVVEDTDLIVESYYKNSIAETSDTCDIGINKIDRMVNYHFTIHKKE